MKQAVDPARLAELAPGFLVAVRVDPENPTRVVMDWSEPRGEPALPLPLSWAAQRQVKSLS